MDQLFEVIHLTLAAIAKSVYNLWFLIVLWIVFILIKKMKGFNIYNLEYSKSTIAAFIESILQGIIVGIIGSLIIVVLGLPINWSIYLVFLLPISLVLSLINIRYICISYSASIIGVLALFLNGQELFGLRLPDIDLNVNGLMALVGVLHLMESILIYFVGADDCTPIIVKKNGQIILGHILQKYWPIPIAILFVTLGTASADSIRMPDWWPLLKPTSKGLMSIYFGLIPLVGVLGYSSVSFIEEPERRAKKTARLLLGYSLLMIAISIIAKSNSYVSFLGLVLMTTLHDVIIQFEQRRENSGMPIYTIPPKGVRIMHVAQGSLAQESGMMKGCIIKKINDIEILNVEHYKEIMGKRFTFLWFETEHLNKEKRIHEIKAYPEGLLDVGIKLIPENPRVLFNYDNLKQIGMIHLIRNRYGRK